MQTPIPKIKLSRSGTKSNTPSPRIIKSVSHDRIDSSSLKTDRPKNQDVDKSQLPKQGRKSRRVISQVNLPTGSLTPDINKLPIIKRLIQPASLSIKKSSRSQKKLNNYFTESSDAENLSSSLEGPLVPQPLGMEKVLEQTETSTIRGVERSSYDTPDFDNQTRLATDNNELSTLRPRRKHTTSVSRAINLDNLSEDELYKMAVDILKKAPGQRISIEIKILSRCVAHVDFFRKYDQNTVENCLKHMYYVSLEQNEKVFEAGTMGTTFWVILKGSVGVVVDIPKEVGHNEKGEKIIEKVPVEVKVLTSGAAFGELALMNSKPRSATIVCKEICEFAVLEKGPFKVILSNSMDEKEKKNLFIQLDFLSNVPALKAIPYHVLHWLYLNTEVKKFSRGQLAYDEGESSNNFYIIKSGEFKVLKTIEDNDETEGAIQNSFSKLMRKATSRRAHVEIAILGQKEIFGEEELLVPNMKRRYSVVCHSIQAEVYEVSRENFEKKLLPFAAMKEWLINYIENKEKYYNQRLKTIREARTDNRIAPLFHLDKPRSPLKNSESNYTTIEQVRQLDNSENGINPNYIKRTKREETDLEAKKKAFLNSQCRYAAMTIIAKSKQEAQQFDPQNDSKEGKRSKSDTRTITKSNSNQIDYQNNKLSLMRVNLDKLKSRNRIARSRGDSIYRYDKISPKRTIEGSFTTKAKEEKTIRLKSHEDFGTNNGKDSVKEIFDNSRLAPVKSFHVRTLELAPSESLKQDSKKEHLNSLYEKIVLKKLMTLPQNCASADGQKRDLSPPGFTTLTLKKSPGKIYKDSRTLDNRPIVGYTIFSEAGDLKDTCSYLMNKLDFKVQQIKSKRGVGDMSPQRDENPSFLVSNNTSFVSTSTRGVDRIHKNSKIENSSRISKKTLGEEESISAPARPLMWELKGLYPKLNLKKS